MFSFLAYDIKRGTAALKIHRRLLKNLLKRIPPKAERFWITARYIAVTLASAPFIFRARAHSSTLVQIDHCFYAALCKQVECHCECIVAAGCANPFQSPIVVNFKVITPSLEGWM